VQVGEFAGVAALSRRLDLDEADKRVVDDDGIIRPCLHLRERRFADKRQAARREIAEFREFAKQPFQRRPKLIFGAPAIAGLSSLARASAPKAETTLAKVAVGNGRSESIEDRWFGVYR
jgi:hypothetical protein